MFCCLRTCLNGNIHKNKKPVVNRVKEPEIHLDAANSGSIETIACILAILIENLPISLTGTEVILLSNYLRITGTGGALATAPLVQSKSYFEVKIQQKGIWSVGLATRQADLDKKYGGLDKESWCLCSDNVTRHNCEENGPVVATINEPKVKNGDLILNGSVPGLIGIEDINEDLLLTTGRSDGDGDMEATKSIPHQNADSGLDDRTQHAFPDEGDIVGVAFDHIELNFYFNGKNLDVPFRNVKASTVYPVIYGMLIMTFTENMYILYFQWSFSSYLTFTLKY